MVLYNYNKTKSYDLSLVEDELVLMDGDIKYKINKNGISHNFLKKFFGFDDNYEYSILDINLKIICSSCVLQFKIDIHRSLLLGTFTKSIDNYLNLMIDENMNVYISEYRSRLVQYNEIDELLYTKILNTCIKIFGEDLCRKSAFTYAQKNPRLEKKDTSTGEFLRGEKRPIFESGLFEKMFIHEKGFKFKEIKTYNIENLQVKEIYSQLNSVGKKDFHNLFLVMQPNGQWWISAGGMGYSESKRQWVNYEAYNYFNPLITYGIELEPIDDFKKIYYLKDFEMNV